MKHNKVKLIFAWDVEEINMNLLQVPLLSRRNSCGSEHIQLTVLRLAVQVRFTKDSKSGMGNCIQPQLHSEWLPLLIQVIKWSWKKEEKKNTLWGGWLKTYFFYNSSADFFSQYLLFILFYFFTDHHFSWNINFTWAFAIRPDLYTQPEAGFRCIVLSYKITIRL